MPRLPYLLLLVTLQAQAEGVLGPGVDGQLTLQLQAQTRLFRAVHSAPFGIGIDVSARSVAALETLRTFAVQTGPEDRPLEPHPYTLVVDYSGPAGIGLRGGGAAPATAFRYLALKREGAPADVLAAARRDVVRAIETLHVVVAITGVPGRVARGVQRLLPEDPEDPPIPLGDQAEPVPLFDAEGHPLPLVKNNGTRRADNSGGTLPPGHWEWEDSCSRDQLVGWVLAMATLYDAARDDPDIAPSLLERMSEDARAVAAMLREKHPMETIAGTVEEFDLIIMDADGRPTQHHDLHPSGLDTIWAPSEAGPINRFNLIMALGILTGLYHVGGGEEAEAFLYRELYHERGYLDLVPQIEEDGPLLFVGKQTNFSSVNMIALSIFLAIRYESDPGVLARLRGYLEHIWWDMAGEARAARHLGQPYFHAIYLMLTDRGTSPTLVAEAADLLKAFPLAPYTDQPRINCDEGELAAGTCVAIDGVTPLILDAEKNRGDHPIATEAVSPAIRPPSNFNARSDPFEVNGGADPLRLLPGGDLVAAYWMLRWLEALPPGTASRSPFTRTHMPVDGRDPGTAEPEPEPEPALAEEGPPDADSMPAAEGPAAPPEATDDRPDGGTGSAAVPAGGQTPGGCSAAGRKRGRSGPVHPLVWLVGLLWAIRPTSRRIPTA